MAAHHSSLSLIQNSLIADDISNNEFFFQIMTNVLYVFISHKEHIFIGV